MRKIILGSVVTLVLLYAFKYYKERAEDNIALQESTALIEKQIKNVGKIIVTEGHFSEVFNYKKSKDFFGDFLTSEKKALVVVNADVTIAYDLSKIKFDIDEANKELIITNIPEEEIKIYPDFEYYDVQSDFFNPFGAKDYNDIKTSVKKMLAKKIALTNLKSNAKNRLISELSKFYILTSSLGWTLKHNNKPVLSNEALQNIKR